MNRLYVGILVAAVTVSCHAGTPTTPAVFTPAVDLALDRTGAVWALPADTQAVVAIGNLATFVAESGIGKAVRSRREWYENEAVELVAATGQNLLDPKTFPAVGLDPDGVWGAAILDGSGDTMVIFAPVTDADKLKTTLYRAAGKEDAKLHVTPVDDALVIVPENERAIAVAIDGDLAYFIAADQPRGDAGAVATALVTRPSSESLAATDAFQHATGDLSAGGDVAAYVAPGFFSGVMDLPPGVLGAAAIGGEIEAAKARVAAVVDVPAGSPLSRILQPGRSPSPVIDDTSAAMAASASLDLTAAVRNPAVAELLEDISEDLDLDVAAEVLPLLSGDVGVALRFDAKGVAAAKPLADAIDVSVTAKTTDPDGAEALLAKLAAHPGLAPMVERQDDGAYRLTVPDWEGKSLFVTVAGDLVVASTDARVLAARTEGKKAAPGAAIARLEPSWWGFVLFAGIYAFSVDGHPMLALPPPPSTTTPEIQALEKKVAALEADMDANRKHHKHEVLTTAAALFDDFGTTTIRVDVDPRGWRISASQNFGRPMADAVTGVVARLAHIAEIKRSRWRQLDASWAEIRALKSHIAELRARQNALTAAPNSIGNLKGGGFAALTGNGKSFGVIGLGSGAGTILGVGASGKVKIGQGTSHGSLDRNIIRRFVRRQMGRLRYCYEQQLVKDPSLNASVVVTFTIDGSGIVSRAAARPRGKTTAATTAVATCVEKVIRKIRFPRPRGGGQVTVKYPFTFKAAP